MPALTKDRPLEPTWEIAQLFPMQGQWSIDDYLELDEGRIIEYSHGYLEVHDMPSMRHQRIVFLLAKLLDAFVLTYNLGEVLLAPLRVQLWEGKIREPDIVFMLSEHKERLGEKFWIGADLVMEVVSPDDRGRDLRTKRREYAMAGIPEYWIVDPEKQQIIVLTLDGEQYLEHGIFEAGTQATSVLLDGFGVVVRDVFAKS